jgi:signal peptidase I
MMKSAQRWARSLAELAGILLILMIAKGAVAEPFYVPSQSMEPTLLIGDALVASKYPYGYGMASVPMPITLGTTHRLFGAMPERGDVVVFRWPGDISQIWVKRVVALPGERVQMRHGQLFIDGRPAPLRADGMGQMENDDGSRTRAARYIETLPGGRSHAIFKIGGDAALDNTIEVTVPAGHVFVLGDNRDRSADSRVPLSRGGVGLLPVENLTGRVEAIAGSWDLGLRGRPLSAWLTGFRTDRFFTAVR